MDISWLDLEHLDSRAVDGAVAMLEAANAVDSPHQPSRTMTDFVADIRHGWDGDPTLIAVANDGDRRVVGVLELSLPSWDNRHLAFVGVTVDPLVRRRGIGRQLFELGVERVRAAGRTLVVTDSFDIPASRAFAAAMGLDQASVEVQRRQEPLTLDWERLEHEYRLAEQHAAGYELLRLPGRTPDHLIAEIGRMAESINDAPTDDWDIEDEVFDPERLRARDVTVAARQRRTYRVLARQRGTGELAGHTVVEVEMQRPWLGYQGDTSVVRAHRGHRLGLYLKIAMLRWLRTEEPQLRVVDTWNAASNDHMIAINELLGYRVVATALGWQRHLSEEPATAAAAVAGVAAAGAAGAGER